MNSERFHFEIDMTGIPASPGVAIGRAFVLDRSRLVGSQYHIAPEEVAREHRRFRLSVSQSQAQMQRLLQRLASKGAGTEHTYILEAHLLMLQDPDLAEGVRTRISEQLVNAEWALRDFLSELKENFSRIDDEYFQERGNDVDQVGQRILRNLLGRHEPSLGRIPARSVVVSHDLTPADTVQMLRGHIQGFVTELGGRTSHIAILARSMEVPALVGLEGVVQNVSTGDDVIVDGENGIFIIRPTGEVLQRYRAQRRRLQRYSRQASLNRNLPAQTRDGVRIQLAANVEKLDELDTLAEHGAEGVGLYRTEYLFLDRRQLPREEEQYIAYRQVLAAASGQPVIIRTLDLGADKGLLGEDSSGGGKQLNPALGLRGVRYCLRHTELFEPQLRALLRASVHGDLRIMVPMISTVEEVRSVKVVLNRCRVALLAEGVELPEVIPFGVMIETPSAALIAERLAREVDFFSIGTNDLVHYTLAVDRLDERVAHLYQPTHPSILMLLQRVVEGARVAGIPVSVCGEMAGEALLAPLLVGLGILRLSMSPMSIPRVKAALRRIHSSQAREIVQQALERSRAGDIDLWLGEQLRRLVAQRL